MQLFHHALKAVCLLTLLDSIAEAQVPSTKNSQSYFIQNERPPGVRTEIGVLGLVREKPESQLLAVDQDFNQLLDASELQGSMQFGLRVNVEILQVSSRFGGVDAQLGYFGINSLDAGTTLLAEDEVITIFFNTVPADPEATSNFHYSSNLYSSELNLRFRAKHRIRPIAGFRFFKLEDTFDTFNHGTGGTSRIGAFSLTNNTMFGGQFGVDRDVPLSSRCQFYSFGKLGLMGNRVEGTANARDTVSSNEVVKNYMDEIFSSLVEAGAGIEYNFIGPLSFRCGYHMLYASKVATGPDQSAAIPLLSPGGDITFNSQQWHGLNLTAIWDF